MRLHTKGAGYKKGAVRMIGRHLPCPAHFLVLGGGYCAINYKGSVYLTTMDG